MLHKKQVASFLFRAMTSGGISFNSAIKTYGLFDPIFSRKISKSQRRIRKIILRNIADATGKNNKLCWSSVLFPAEILRPFGIYPLTLEVISGIYATMGLANRFLERADVSDIPNTMCSFHRVLLGASETRLMGKPVLVGSTSVMCDGNLKSFSEAAINKNVPFLFIDVPYNYSDDAALYVKEQLLSSFALLEEVSGQRFDESTFRATVKNVNEAFHYGRVFYKRMLENKNNLYRGHEIANFAFPMHFLLGTRSLVDLIKMRSESFENDFSYNRFFRSQKLNPKARRIMWLHIVPQYDIDMWDIVDNGENSRIVCDEYSAPYYEDYDESDPLLSIAKRLIRHPSNGPIERRIDHILKVAKDYNVDGMIHYSSWGCHQASGNVQILGKAVVDAGYKFLNLNSDPIDERNASIEQHRTRLEAFLEN